MSSSSSREEGELEEGEIELSPPRQRAPERPPAPHYERAGPGPYSAGGGGGRGGPRRQDDGGWAAGTGPYSGGGGRGSRPYGGRPSYPPPGGFGGRGPPLPLGAPHLGRAPPPPLDRRPPPPALHGRRHGASPPPPRRPSPTPGRRRSRSPLRRRRSPSPPPPRRRSSPALPARRRSPSPPPRRRSPSPPPRRRSLSVPGEAGDAGAQQEQGRADLAASIESLTEAVGLQDCLRHLEGVCKGLLLAIRKAHALFKLLKQGDEELRGAEDSKELAAQGLRILGGLRSLHVYSTTGQGRSMGAAREAVRAAWREREVLFAPPQRTQLEGFVSSSRNFAALLEDGAGEAAPQRQDYVPAPRPAPAQPKKKQPPPPKKELPPPATKAARKRQLASNGQPSRPASAAEQDAANRSAEAAAAAGQAALAAAAVARQRREAAAAAEAEAAAKRYKIQVHIRTSSLDMAAQPHERQPAASLPEPAFDMRFRSAAEQQQRPAQGELPPLPLEPPASPISVPVSPISPGPESGGAHAADWEQQPAANGHAPMPEAAGAAEQKQQASVRSEAEVQELLGQGKLCLVLDLDHTLLNSATFSEVGQELGAQLEARCATEAGSLPEDQRLLFRMEDIKMWTKLRPGVREFLQRAARYYQLWIHTNGNRSYADSVIRLLDPDGAYFERRVIAQGADNAADMRPDQAKRLMQGLAQREAVTVIVDDSHGVWEEHRHNLVAVERYIYFPASRTSLGLMGPSLLEANRDESPEQGMLSVCLEVLLRVHRRVLTAMAAAPITLPSGEVLYQNWDVRHVLAEERQQVLTGVVLVFTRVIPLEMRPEAHPLWRMAESFGAHCTTQLDDKVTHVVAAANGTEKVLQARAMGKYVVSTAWLECSCVLWKRAHEERFPLPP